MEGLALGARYRSSVATVGSVPFDAGNQRTLELPRSFLYKSLVLRISGTVSTVAATVNPQVEQPFALIKKIEVVADGRKILFSIAGRDAYRLSQLFRGKAPEIVVAPGAAIATQPFAGTIILDHEAARMVSPVDSYFDPRPYEKIELRITWANGVADMFGTPNAAVFVTAPSIDVQLMQTVQGAEMIGFNRLLLFDEVSVTATSSNLTLNVPRAGLLAGILLRTDSTSAGLPNPSDTILNFVSVKSDNNFLHVDRLAWATLQRRNVIEYQLDIGSPTVQSMGTQIPGYAYVDLTEDGLISSALNTLDLNVLQLIFDATLSGTSPLIRVTYVFYEPIALAG